MNPERIKPRDKKIAIEMAASGASWGEVLDVLQVTQLEFWKAMQADRNFLEDFLGARKAGMHVKADKLESISDTITDHVTRMRAELYSKNLQWLLARRLPKEYGDNLNLTVQERPNARKVLDSIDRAMVTGPTITTTATTETDEERERRILIESML